jgi:hypothetical protein
MWNAIRMLPSFSGRELAYFASTDTVVVAIGTARAYVRLLAKAGYLRREKERYYPIPGKVKGPKAPMIQRLKTVFDPNINEIVYQEGISDE